MKSVPTFLAMILVNLSQIFLYTFSANVSDDHEHEDDCDIQALVEFTRVQEQVIQMYNSLCEETSRVKEDGVLSSLCGPKEGEDKIQV